MERECNEKNPSVDLPDIQQSVFNLDLQYQILAADELNTVFPNESNWNISSIIPIHAPNLENNAGPAELLNFTDRTSSCRSTLSDAPTVIEASAHNPTDKSQSSHSSASHDLLRTTAISDNKTFRRSEHDRFENRFRWVDKSRRFSQPYSIERENQSQIDWIKKFSEGDSSPRSVKNVGASVSPRRAILSPEGPSYGFCEVPSLSKPDPPTVAVYEPSARPDRVFRNEEGTTVKVIKLEDIPKENRTESPQRKKREVVKLLDTDIKQDRFKRKEIRKPTAKHKPVTTDKTSSKQGLASRHSLPPKKAYDKTTVTFRTKPSVKISSNVKDTKNETALKNLMAKIEKLKEEHLLESKVPVENVDEKEKSDFKKKEKNSEESTTTKQKSDPLKNTNTQNITEGHEAETNQAKRARSYDPQIARDYIKKKRAERVDKSSKDQDKRIQELQEKKNKLLELKKSQIKALKSCVKKKIDNENEVRPEWVGVLEKEESESEPCKLGGFGAIRKQKTVPVVHSEKGLKIEQVKAALDKKKKSHEINRQSEGKLRTKLESDKINTTGPESMKNTSMVSECAQTEGETEIHPEQSNELIVLLSAQVKELSENLENFKNSSKRPASPLRTTDTAVQVGQNLDKTTQIGRANKRQKINLTSCKETTSKGIQVVPVEKNEIEKKPDGVKTPEWFREFCEETRPFNLINTVKRKLNYYNRLDEERAKSEILKQEPRLLVEELKLDFSRSSIDTNSKSGDVQNPGQDTISSLDQSFKSVVASLSLKTKNEYSSSAVRAQDLNKSESAANLSSCEHSGIYVELESMKIDKDEAAAIFEPIKSDTLKSISEIDVEPKEGESEKSVDVISSHCENNIHSGSTKSLPIHSEGIRNEEQQMSKSSEILLPHSEPSKSSTNLKSVSAKCCASIQSSHESYQRKLFEHYENSSQSKGSSPYNKIPGNNCEKSIDPDSLELRQPQSSRPLDVAVSPLPSKNKKSTSESSDVRTNKSVKSICETDTNKRSGQTLVSGNTSSPKSNLDKNSTFHSILSPASVSDTTISECFSADPLKLPNSIGKLKLLETFPRTSDSRNSRSELVSDYSSTGGIVSNALISHNESEYTKEPSNKEINQGTSFEHQTTDLEPSNNTVTFSTGSLQCRFEDELNRLNALNMTLNTAIDRNRSMTSRNITKNLQSDLDTFSVTEVVEKVTSEIVEGNGSRESEVSTVSIQKSVTLSTNTSLLSRLQFPEKLRVYNRANKENSDESDMGLTKFSLNMFTELVKDEELRFRHQSALLKLRGKTLFEKTAAELAWLELQRRKEKEKGNDEMVKNIRKKQRGIVMKHQEDMDEIRRLLRTERAASRERQLLFLQQQQMAKLQMVAKNYSEKKNISETNKVNKMQLGHTSVKLPAVESEGKENCPYSVKRLSESNLEKQKRLLKERETTLKARKEAVEGLVTWKKRLELEERRIKEMEKMATRLSPYVSCRRIDRGTSPFPGTPEPEVFSIIGTKSLTSNSTIPEDIQSQQNNTLSQSEVEEYSNISKAIDYLSDSSKLSSVVSEHLMSASFPVNDKGSLSGEEKRRNSMVPIKIPLSPRVSRAQRRHSSGSDESILFSQNETQSEQSDMEVRVCALQQQLRQRKAELERLKRERHKSQRERLRAKEQSLLNQIQAYDAYIEQVKTEIKRERELDATDVKIMKPQIKQPKVAERRKSDLWLPSEKKKDDSENSSNETVQSPVQKAESSRDSTYISEEIEQESSENTDSVKTFLESSTFPPKEEVVKDRFSSLSGSESVEDSESVQTQNEVSTNITEKLEALEEELEESKTVSCSVSDSREKIEIDVQSEIKDIEAEAPDIETESPAVSEKSKTVSFKHSTSSELLEENQEEDTKSVSEESPKLMSVHTVYAANEIKEITSENEQDISSAGDVTANDRVSNEDEIVEPELNYEESFCEESAACSLPPLIPCEQDQVSDVNIEEQSCDSHTSSERHVLEENLPVGAEKIDIEELLPDREIEEDVITQLEEEEEVDKLIKEIESYDLDDVSEQSILTDTENEIIKKTLMIEERGFTEQEASEKEQTISSCEDSGKQQNDLSQVDQILDAEFNNQVQEAKEMMVNRIADEIMLNILYESVTLSEKLWKNNLEKVEDCKKVSEDTPLLKALQDENKENNSRTDNYATVNSVTETICNSYVEEATEAVLQAYFKKASLSPRAVVESTDITTSPVPEIKSNKKVGENEGNWLGEEFTTHTSKEAEELRLQQLQIEQEIEELEQATQVPYYYVREIPNKPPPPYTPPKKVPTKEELVSTVVDGVSILWEMFVDQNIDIFSAEMPADYLARVEDKPYREFMFDLSREIFLQYKNPNDAVKVPPWQKVLPRKRFNPPIRTKDDLIKIVERQVKVIFGFEPKAQKEKLIIRWSRKKRDHVDELLVRESQEEESEWTDFSVEENIVKNEVADMIINKVLQDAIDSLITAFNNKFKPDMT